MIRVVQVRDVRIAYLLGEMEPNAATNLRAHLQDAERYPLGFIASFEDAGDMDAMIFKCLIDMRAALGDRFVLVCPAVSPAYEMLAWLAMVNSIPLYECVEAAADELGHFARG